MQNPDYVTVQTLKNFMLSKTPLYRGLVDAYWLKAPLSNVRVDYAIFYALWFTNYFRGSKGGNDFGGGTAQDMQSGVELAIAKLKALDGDYLKLPSIDFEGIKYVETQFLAFVNVKSPELPPKSPELPKPTPVVIAPDLPPAKQSPVPLPVPADTVKKPVPIDTKPVPSNGGFWRFIRTLAGFLGVINAVLFIARLWLPAPVVALIQGVIKIIADLAAQHPAESFAALVTATVTTHAMALKTAVPAKWREVSEKWQRPVKSAL